MKIKLISILLIATLSLVIVGCSNKEGVAVSIPPSSSQNPSTAVSPTPTPTPTQISSVITMDRMGNPITLPKKIEKIMVAGPSNGEILSGLGFADKIIASDKYSANIAGIKNDIPQFDMSKPDVEQIVNLKPDVIFVTGLVKFEGNDPYKPISDTGICVIYIPSSKSIEGIKEDIKYVANVMGVPSKGDLLVQDMEKEIENIKSIGDTITDKKSVYFEIGSAPNMYSFGDGVYLNEMLEIIGAKNIMSDQNGWFSVADEVVIAANPDIILTNVNYIENPTDEIKARAGWNELNAIKNNNVYYIDADASARPSQNIVKALKDMAKAVYPNEYK